MKKNSNESSAPIATSAAAAAFAASLAGVKAINSHKWENEPSLGYEWELTEFPWHDTAAVQGLILAAGQFLGNSSMGKIRNLDAPLSLLVKFCHSKSVEFGTIRKVDKDNAKAKFDKINASSNQDGAWVVVEANAAAKGVTLESRDLEGLEKAFAAVRRYVENQAKNGL